MPVHHRFPPSASFRLSNHKALRNELPPSHYSCSPVGGKSNDMCRCHLCRTLHSEKGNRILRTVRRPVLYTHPRKNLASFRMPQGHHYDEKSCFNFTTNTVKITWDKMIRRLFASLRIPLDFGALEHGHHTNRDERRFDNRQRSEPPEDLLRVQGRIPFLIVVEVRVLQIFGNPAR